MDDKTASAVGGAVVLVLLFLMLEPMCTPRVVVPPDPNEKLAEIAKQAVEMAREANERTATAERSSDWGYFIALAAGVTVPLVVALLLFRYYAQAPSDATEVFLQLQEFAEDGLLRLPPPEHEALADPSAQDDSARRDDDDHT